MNQNTTRNAIWSVNCILSTAALVFLCLATCAGSVADTTIICKQAYPGHSTDERNASWAGYLPQGADVASAAPGVLQIVPGANWANFVSASQQGVSYMIKNVLLRKVVPESNQCADIFLPRVIYQHGTPNVRKWWPLMYEAPGTTWTLNILYGTYLPTQLPGESKPSYVHSSEWKWKVVADIGSMRDLINLFHALPFGMSQTPIISDENLYASLKAKLELVQSLYDSGDRPSAGMALAEFEMELADACIAVPPSAPHPSGLGSGIANSSENPACSILMVDAEYVGRNMGIFVQTK